MAGRKVVLNDGTTFEGNCGYADGYLWVYLENVEDPESLVVFLNQEAISRIVYQYGDMEDVFEGFGFQQLQVTEAGYNVCLKRGVVDV